MKKVFIISAIILACSFKVRAQGRYSGSSSLGLEYGIASKGNMANLNWNQYVGRNYLGYRVDISYLQKDKNVRIYDLEYESDFNRLSIGSAIVYSLESVIRHPFYVQMFLGGQYGIEKINGGKDTIDNIPYVKPKQNSYGVYGGVELEAEISFSFSIVVSPKYSFTNSKIQREQFSIGVGLRYLFNN